MSMYRQRAHRSQVDTETCRAHLTVSRFPVISGTVPFEERLSGQVFRPFRRLGVRTMAFNVVHFAQFA